MLLSRKVWVSPLAALALVTQVVGTPAAAQPIKRVETIWTTTEEAASPYVKALEEGLAAYGWSIGTNLLIRHNFTNAEPDKLPIHASEIVARNPDLIWAALNTGALAIKQRTSIIPIVVGNTVDPVGVGLVSSLNRPGGNITGMVAPGIETYGKRVQLLQEALPRVRTVGILYNQDFPGIRTGVELAEKAAAGKGIRIIVAPMRAPGEIRAAFTALVDQGVEAVLIPSDNLTFLYRREIIEMALKARLPSVFPVREFCDLGGLICYSSNMRAMFKRSAILVDRILKGANPGELPLEQPAYFELVVNMRTARFLELNLGNAIFAQADELIE